jgi:alpha-beta hydrolase superfamily lysophospholipase
MAQREPRYSMLNFDLRGHGRSASSSGKKRLDWSTTKDEDTPDLVRDVHAAIQHGLQESEGKAPGVVLVGAALAAAAAGEEPTVMALALVAPGAAISRFDVYYPFADVRMLPSFIAGAKDDNVSREPVDALGRMARDAGTVKQYEGNAHGAVALLAGVPAFADDLEAWLMTVYDDKPVERAIREPAASKKKPTKKGK